MALPTSRFARLIDRALNSLTTPRRPEDYLELVAPLASGADLRARVESVVPEARDAVSVTLHPGRGWLGHQAGQYIRIGVDVDGVRHWRAYSITSPVGNGDRLTFTCKKIPDGLVSTYINHELRSGDIIELDQAAGDFVVGPQTSEKVLFITGGSGLTPVAGMLRSGVAKNRQVTVVHSCPTPADMLFADELRERAAAGEFVLHLRYTDAQGVITCDEIAQLVPDWETRSTFVCGPLGLLEACEEYWAQHHQAHRLHTERFRTRILAVGEGGEATFSESGITVNADAGTPLLDAGESAGVLMPSGCRMGVCFGCVARLNFGTVRDLRTGELTTADGDDDVSIQTCVNAAAGACDIAL